LTTWKRRVSAASFSKYFVFGPGCRGDRAQFAARQGRLQQIGGVALSRLTPGADHRVRFVDEENDRPRARLDFLDHRFEPVFELASDPGARLQQSEIEGPHDDFAQRGRHIALRDAYCEPLDDRGFSDPRLAGQDRVVLAPPRQNVDDLADLGVAAEDRVDFPRLRHRCEVDRELRESDPARRYLSPRLPDVV